MQASISFDIAIPDVGATHEQIDAWIRFRLNEIHRAETGPLVCYGLEPIPGTLMVMVIE